MAGSATQSEQEAGAPPPAEASSDGTPDDRKAGHEGDVAAGVPAEWQIAKNGRKFLRIPGVGGYAGIVWRKGDDETPDQARDRWRAGGHDKPPRTKKARREEARSEGHTAAVKPIDSRTTARIQEMVADILCAPSMPCGMFGLDWEAEHFSRQGERFAGNIAKASERNPWLRKKLEKALSGETTVIAWLTSLNLATGAIGYSAPLLMKWGVMPVPDSTKAMFGVPIVRPGLPPQRVPPPPTSYRPPVTEAMQNAAEMFANAERASATPPPAYPPGHEHGQQGVQDPHDAGVSQPS